MTFLFGRCFLRFLSLFARHVHGVLIRVVLRMVRVSLLRIRLGCYPREGQGNYHGAHERAFSPAIKHDRSFNPNADRRRSVAPAREYTASGDAEISPYVWVFRGQSASRRAHRAAWGSSKPSGTRLAQLWSRVLAEADSPPCRRCNSSWMDDRWSVAHPRPRRFALPCVARGAHARRVWHRDGCALQTFRAPPWGRGRASHPARKAQATTQPQMHSAGFAAWTEDSRTGSAPTSGNYSRPVASRDCVARWPAARTQMQQPQNAYAMPAKSR